MAGSYKVYIDWNGDGDYVDASEDVTTRVLDGRVPVTMDYGRDQTRNLSPIKVGTAEFALDNADRYLSPENTSSPLYGNVQPGRRVKITVTVSSVETTLYTGYLNDFKVEPAYDDRYINADCLDSLGRLRGQKVSTQVYQGLRPGEALGILLDAVGWPPADRDIETGTTLMPFWWVDEADAFDAAMELIATEGPPALITIDSADRFVFRGRHHRLLRAASLTSQSTWYSSGSLEPGVSSPATYGHGWQEIINSISFQLPQRAIAPPAPVWESEGQISIAAGDTLPVVARGADGFVNAIVPVQTTSFDDLGNPNGDYTLVSGTVSMTLSQTSGQSVTIFITASSAAVISDLQLRASAVATVNTTLVKAEDAGSVAEFGRKSLPDENTPTWASRGDATSIAGIILGQRAERLPTISVTMVGTNAARLAQQLNRDLSDRVHLVETHTGLDADCFIEQIGHEVTQGGAEHRTTFGLEKIPTQLASVFILGSATNGVLGTNRLGRRGFVDPTMIFTLGSATNGVLGSDVLAP